jgi:hypothetical protein
MIKLLLCATVLAFASCNSSAQVRSGPNTEWRKTESGFGAALMFTKDTEAFVHEWTTTREEHRLRIDSPEEVHAGEYIGPLLFFWGCHPSAGTCRVYVDFEFVGPDGAVRHQVPDKLGTPQPSPKAELVYLSQAIVRFRVQPGEPLGTYRINATVREPSAGTVLRLTRQIRVIK